MNAEDHVVVVAAAAASECFRKGGRGIRRAFAESALLKPQIKNPTVVAVRRMSTSRTDYRSIEVSK